MISPVLFYNILISIIGVSQYFTQAYTLDPGGNGRPGGSTFFFNLNLYKEGWTYNNMGYASALAWVMMFIVVVGRARALPDVAHAGCSTRAATMTGERGRRCRWRGASAGDPTARAASGSGSRGSA